MAKENKYLTFVLDRQDYGINILNVIEIVGIVPITPLPKSPNYVKGVINLRGKIIPVMDLRLKLEMESAEFDEKTCIIVTEIMADAKPFSMGIIVDTVSEVTSVSDEEMEEIPHFGSGFQPSFILGMAKQKDRVKTLLDIQKILVEEVEHPSGYIA